jgi:acetyltransferase-like isoleucine patch superfamily enzyme
MTAPLTLEHDWFPRPLPDNVELGSGSWLYSSYAFLHYRSRRPRGLRVGQHSGVYVGTMFDLGPEGEVEIGDYCAIVGPIISTNQRIGIGDYAFISYDVVLADSPFATPQHSETREDERGGEGIVIGENVWIGARATLLSGARIGEGAIIGAVAVVDFEVPDYAVVAGNPARVVGWARPREPAPR